MFLGMLHISKAASCAADISAIVHFLYPKLGSFSDMEYSFYKPVYGDLKVPKHFIKCSVLLLLTASGANEMTLLHVGTRYTHIIGFSSKRNVSATHQIPTLINVGTAPLKFSPYFVFRAKGGRKTIDFFSHFLWLIITEITFQELRQC